MKTFTLSCPTCGYFESGMNAPRVLAIMHRHQLSMVLFDDTYARLLGETLLEAEHVVGVRGSTDG